MREVFARMGRAFEAIGGLAGDGGSLNDPFRKSRNSISWAAAVFGLAFGVGLLIRYPGTPKLLVVAAFGLATLVVAIVAMRTRTKRESIRRTVAAVLMVALTIGLMVLIHAIWPPLFG